jgi:hypothetical protein
MCSISNIGLFPNNTFFYTFVCYQSEWIHTQPIIKMDTTQYSLKGPSGDRRAEPGSSCYWESTLVPESYSPGVVDAHYSLSPPKIFCVWWRATSYGRWPCCAEHRGSKGVNIGKIPSPAMWVPYLWDEWQWVSLQLTTPTGISGDLPDVSSLAEYRGPAWLTLYFPWSCGKSPSSLSSLNLEVLAEKFCTLGLQGRLNWTWWVPYHLFKPTCNTALLHRGLSLGQWVLKE